MKTKHSIAAQKRALRKELTAQGLKSDAIDKAIAATFGGTNKAELKSLPRKLTSQILALFRQTGKGSSIAVVWCKSGAFRVYNKASYDSLQKTGQRAGKAKAKANKKK